MKTIIGISTLSILMALAVSITSYGGENDLSEHGLKGNVRSLTRMSSVTYIQDGKPTTSVNEKDYLFDRKGKILEIHSSTSFSGVKDTIRGSEYVAVYIYNEKGLLASEISTNTGENKPFKVISYTYDDKNREVAQLHKSLYSSESTDVLVKTVYNNNGQRAERISLASESDGSFKEREKWQYKYDTSGREIERHYYDYEARRYWKDQSIVYKGSSDVEAERYMYHTDGSIYTKDIYTYNDEGKLSATVSFRNGESLGTTHYTYTDRDVAGNYCKKVVAPELSKGVSSSTTYVIAYY